MLCREFNCRAPIASRTKHIPREDRKVVSSLEAVKANQKTHVIGPHASAKQSLSPATQKRRGTIELLPSIVSEGGQQSTTIAPEKRKTGRSLLLPAIAVAWRAQPYSSVASSRLLCAVETRDLISSTHYLPFISFDSA
jgi:hypothetical protein